MAKPKLAPSRPTLQIKRRDRGTVAFETVKSEANPVVVVVITVKV